MTRHIITDRLVLRPFRAEDGPRVVALLNDFEVSKWLARVPFPFADTDLRLVDPDGQSRWPGLAAITHRGEVIGGISSADHFGYWLGRAYWRQGFMSEAAAAMLTHVFVDQGRAAISSGYFTGNPVSGRILRRLGFREVSRDMQLCRARGVDVSNVNMEATRTSWEAAS